jgi:predicted O-methyltransferase YrrM
LSASNDSKKRKAETLMRKIFRTIAKPIKKILDKRKNTQIADQLRMRAENGEHWKTFIPELCLNKENVHTQPFIANQVPSELTELLTVIENIKPKTICEIGSWRGGNLFFLGLVADKSAKILSLDIAHDSVTKATFPLLLRSGQTMTCLHADSALPETVQTVKDWAKGPIDCLFIDGNHELEGVSSDFEKYSPLVRPGGIIVFHDIVQDYLRRYGKNTGNYVGGVPDFWKQVSEDYETKYEFIDDPDQDSYGLGVLIVPENRGKLAA